MQNPINKLEIALALGVAGASFAFAPSAPITGRQRSEQQGLR